MSGEGVFTGLSGLYKWKKMDGFWTSFPHSTWGYTFWSYKPKCICNFPKTESLAIFHLWNIY